MTPESYKENDIITVLKGIDGLDITPGTVGTVWCAYPLSVLQPQSYEILFTYPNSDVIQCLMYDYELGPGPPCSEMQT
jgi:hypothetical protein